jgi:hypothetical protein
MISRAIAFLSFLDRGALAFSRTCSMSSLSTPRAACRRSCSPRRLSSTPSSSSRPYIWPFAACGERILVWFRCNDDERACGLAKFAAILGTGELSALCGRLLAESCGSNEPIDAVVRRYERGRVGGRGYSNLLQPLEFGKRQPGDIIWVE